MRGQASAIITLKPVKMPQYLSFSVEFFGFWLGKL